MNSCGFTVVRGAQKLYVTLQYFSLELMHLQSVRSIIPLLCNCGVLLQYNVILSAAVGKKSDILRTLNMCVGGGGIYFSFSEH